MTMNDGNILFFYAAIFEDFSKFARDFGIFRDDDDTAGFAVKPVDEVRLRGISKI